MEIKIPTIDGKDFRLNAAPNNACVLLGANGSGKTRLSIFLSEQLPKIAEEKINYENSIERYRTEIKDWTEKSDADIKKEFTDYNEVSVPVEGNILNLYQFYEWGLKNNICNLSIDNSPTPPTLPPLCIEEISGGTIGSRHISHPLTVDVDLLKFSEKYRENPEAIGLYKKYKITSLNRKIEAESEEFSKLVSSFLENPFRISAHRALMLNSNLLPIKFDEAKNRFFGKPSSKFSDRKPTTGLQNDFDLLITTLYSEEAEIGAKYVQKMRDGSGVSEAPVSNLSRLMDYWNDIMPHRELKLDGLKMDVKSSNTPEQPDNFYNPSEMSDGERNIFYVLGQCLLAPEKSFLIIDEPELHINKAILVQLWQHIQNHRKDCFFLFVSHDIEFVNSLSCDKFFIKEYQHPHKWDIQKLQEDSEIPEDIRMLIYGSRQPILFVEGKKSSVDKLIYEKAYPGYKIIPVGSCEQVKTYTKSFNTNENLHHLKCCGIIDKDDLGRDEIEELRTHNIYCLEVAIIENIFFVPEILKYLYERENNAEFKENELKGKIFTFVEEHQQDVIAKTIKYRTQQDFQEILSTSTIDNLGEELKNINVSEYTRKAEADFEKCVRSKDLAGVLKIFRNKGLYKSVLKKILNTQDIDKKITVYLNEDETLINLIRNQLPDLRISATNVKKHAKQ